MVTPILQFCVQEQGVAFVQIPKFNIVNDTKVKS